MTLYDEYIEDVTSGKVVVCKWVRLAIERHISDLKKSKKKSYPYYFNRDEADKMIGFIKMLRHTQGKWAKKLFDLRPEQAFIAASIFGWLKKSNHKRRFTKSYNEVARKWGKTEFMSTFAKKGLLADGEFGAEIYSAATKRDQAKILFDRAKVMGKFLKQDSEYINDVLGIHKYNIHVLSTESKMEPLSSDSEKQDGLNPHMALIDEYHAHKSDELIKVIETGMGAREQPLLCIITTAGFNLQGPCYQFRKVCCDILEGKKQDETTFAIIFTLDEDDDWEDETNWIKANPAIGSTPSWDYMRSMYRKAKNEGAVAEVQFKTKNLNIWTGTHATWIEDDTWMKCKIEMPDLLGRECYGGLDLASVRDLAALTLTFPETETEPHYQLYFFWCPEDGAEKRSKQDGVPYLDWINAGYINATPGNVTDYRHIKADILALAESYNLKAINYDRWNSSQIVQELIEEGAEMIPFGQGYKDMSQPTKDLERVARSGALAHDGNPVMRWMMGNVALQIDPAENVKIDKKNSSEKVDGPVSAVMSLAGAMIPKEDEALWGFA